jgi:hypothetical protein
LTPTISNTRTDTDSCFNYLQCAQRFSIYPAENARIVDPMRTEIVLNVKRANNGRNHEERKELSFGELLDEIAMDNFEEQLIAQSDEIDASLSELKTGDARRERELRKATRRAA